MLHFSDVFAIFRSWIVTKGKFEVDPTYYISEPQMALEARLKKTGLLLDLI